MNRAFRGHLRTGRVQWYNMVPAGVSRAGDRDAGTSNLRDKRGSR